jgi:fatty-acyl-CoA synthase
MDTETVYISRLLDRLARRRDAPVLRHRDRDTTAVQLLGSINRYARALAGLGIGRGDLVALFAPDTPDALAVRYGAHLIGAGAVFLSVPTADRRAALVEQMDPKLLVVFPETVAAVPAEVGCAVAAVGGDLPGTTVRLDELAADESTAALACRAHPDDLGVIVSSGGTTGVPKGSVRSFAQYTAMVAARSPADRRQLVNGRLAYLSQVLVDTTLLGGGTVVLRNRFDAADTLATIEAERITDLFLVEPQLAELIGHPDVDRRDLSSLRAITHIGAAAPPTLRRRARERLGARLAHTYGASEMGLVSALGPAEHDPAQPEVFTSAGRVLPGVDVRFRRTDGTLAEPGGIGSIEVRSPAMAAGYRNRPIEQAAAFVDGWYRTGDLGRLDADGRLHILCRATDATWRDGALLAPPVVQDTLCRVPGIGFAVVVVDAAAGDWIAAVAPAWGAAVDAVACAAAVAVEHGADVAERLLVLPLSRIPLTEQGKPDRPFIRRLAAARRSAR